MALFTVTIDEVAGGNASFTGRPGTKLFNTARISQIWEFGASDSVFEYSLEWDGDVQTSVCICDETVSNINAEFAKVYNTGAIPLTSYPYGNLDETETVYLDPRIILFGAEYTNYTKLILSHGRELWVDDSLEMILYLSVIGSETPGVLLNPETGEPLLNAETGEPLFNPQYL